jgi:hypothetical protein
MRPPRHFARVMRAVLATLCVPVAAHSQPLALRWIKDAPHDPAFTVPSGFAPGGFRGRVDTFREKVGSISWTRDGTGFLVQSGPGHIVWHPADTASGRFRVAVRVEQLAHSRDPDAHGLFFGGQALDAPDQRYLYFLIRQNGMYLIKQRSADSLRTLVPWTAHAAVPADTITGRVRAELSVDVAPDSLRFFVNGRRVDAIAAREFDTRGAFGIRVNHDLRLRVERPRLVGRGS